MVDKLDIWRMANTIVQEHGRLCEAICQRYIERMEDLEDDAGQAKWLRFMIAAKTLRLLMRQTSQQRL